MGGGGGNSSCPVPNKSVITNNIISDKLKHMLVNGMGYINAHH